MIVLILFMLPAVLYATVWFISWRGALSVAPTTGLDRLGPQSEAGTESGMTSSMSMRWMLALAIGLHAASIGWTGEGPFRFGFAKALSATLWIGLALLWFEGLRMRLDSLRILVLPIAIIVLLLPLAWPGGDLGTLAQRPLFVPHLVAGTLAYGVLLLAALHALLMLAVQRDLNRPVKADRGSAFARWIDSLPPLMALERILFRLIGLGFVLLLATTLSGLVFSEQVFGKPLRIEHKTVFSLVALAFFGVLLVGRRVRGWRGRIATRITLGGFALLLMGYVGSRFVLEVVLRRL